MKSKTKQTQTIDKQQHKNLKNHKKTSLKSFFAKYCDWLRGFAEIPLKQQQTQCTMKKIKVRNHKTCYDLHLLPCKIVAGQLSYETGNEADVKKISKLMSSLIGKLSLPVESARYFRKKLKYLESSGGVIAALYVTKLDNRHLNVRGRYPEIDLGYKVTKELKITFGNEEVSYQVMEDFELTLIVEKILRELYNYHEKNYLCGREGEDFIEELFLMDEVDMVVDEDFAMNVNIDLSLRDYLVSLNERLRISA